MKWLTGLLIIVTQSAWSQETPEQLRLRGEFSRRAREARLLESTQEASRVLSTLNETQLNCATPLPAAAQAGAPERFVVVGFSGYGTGENGAGQPSGAHDNLPMTGNISETHRLTHSASTAQMDQVLGPFNCAGGAQATENLGLIIMANSWGAGKGHKLAKRYQEKCGREVEIFVMVDGVNKPIPTAFGRRPVARRCVNYYQTYSTLRGKDIDGCENHNLEESCYSGGLANCHIEVEWMGTSMGAELIRDIVN